jgi:hypothetical protein
MPVMEVEDIEPGLVVLVESFNHPHAHIPAVFDDNFQSDLMNLLIVSLPLIITFSSYVLFKSLTQPMSQIKMKSIRFRWYLK